MNCVIKNIKTGHTAANYWSALFRCNRDGRIASDWGQGLLNILNRVLLFLLNCSGLESRSSRFCAGLAVTIKCGTEVFSMCMYNVFLKFLKAYISKTVYVLTYFVAIVLCVFSKSQW
jgi:uncharacterized membrane-anchored protein